MAVTTKSWIVLPVMADAVIAQGNLTGVKYYTSLALAQAAAAKAAIATGKELVIAETTHYAKSELDASTITAQVAVIP